MKVQWILLAAVVLFSGFTVGTESAPPAEGGGIVFMNTAKLEEVKSFYINRLGCHMWLDQGSCAILKYNNLLIGFCQSRNPELDTLITFFYQTKAEVDRVHKEIEARAVSAPRENSKYRIYHFYARDPEGRSIEFQSFLHPIDWDFTAKRGNP